MSGFRDLESTPLGELTPAWCAAVAALPPAEGDRLAAEADALYAAGARDGRRRALWCWLALRDRLDPASPVDGPRAEALLLGLPPGLADASDLARRAERAGGPDLRLAASVHLGRRAADAGDLHGAEARFRSVLAAVRGSGSRIEYLACSSLADLFVLQRREYEALVLSRRLVHLSSGPGKGEATMTRYSLLCLAEALERLEEWTAAEEPLDAVARSLEGTPPGYERSVRIFAALAEARCRLGLGDPDGAAAALDAAEAAMARGIPAGAERRPLLLLRGRVAMGRRRWEEAAGLLAASMATGEAGTTGAAEALSLLVRCRLETGGAAAGAAAARDLLRILAAEGTAVHGSGTVLAAAAGAAAALEGRGGAEEEREELLREAAGAALLRVLEIDRCVREIPEASVISPGDALLLRSHRARFAKDHRALLDSVRRRLAAEHRAGRRPLVRFRPGGGPLRACAWCVRLLTPEGAWIPVGHLVPPGLETPVTHGICPECAVEHFPGFPATEASGC